MLKFNTSNCPEIEESDFSELIEAAYNTLLSVDGPERRRLGQKPDEGRLHHLKSMTAFLVDANSRGFLRLPISAFGRVGSNLPTQAVEVIVSSSPVAVSLKALLALQGIPSKITQKFTPITRRYYEVEFDRVVAGFSMSVTGAKDWGDFDIDTILNILHTYASPNTRSFRRKDLWGAGFDIAGRFLREIARVLGDINTSPRIASFYRAGRYSTPLLFERPPSHLSAWMELYEEWRKSVKAVAKSPLHAIGRLLLWLDENFEKHETVSPKKFLSTKRSTKFIDFLNQQREATNKVKYSSSTLAELGAILRFSEFIASYTGLLDLGVPVFHLLTRVEIQAYADGVNNSGKVNNSGEGSSLPLPPLLYALFQELLSEGESGWPGKHELCRFFAKGEVRYCPVLPSLFLLAFELPGRFGQLTSLDSGEGDEYWFDGNSLQWSKNQSSNAGYWKRRGVKVSRGYARKTRNRNITGFFFNLNKTGKPFVIPWQNRTAHGICWGVRTFVERWVPISSALKAQDYREDLVRSDETYLEKLPDIFPLFRMPSIKSQKYGLPVNSRLRRDFWLDAMLEVQTRYNAGVSPEAALNFVTVDDAGRPVKCEYTPHGMRSAGITRLLREGVSITIVSKLLVGHASILMTQRYNKPDPAEIHDILEGNRLSRQPMRGNLSQLLPRMSFEEASRRTVSGSEEVLKLAYHGARSTFVERDVGLCPWMGQRCGDGGDCIRRDFRNGADKSLYKGVEEGNCLACRHLITDATYLDGIYAKLEVLSRRLTVLLRRYNQVSEMLHQLEMRFAEDKISEDEVDECGRRKRKLQVDLNDIVLAQTSICETIAHGQRYIEQLRLVERFEDKSESVERILVHPENALSEWSETEVRDEWILLSDFEHLTRIMHNASFFTSAYDAEAEASFRLKVDNLTIEAGYRPISFNRRTEYEQKEDYLRASRVILNNINRQELMAMEEGTLTPSDLGFDEIFSGLKLEKLAAETGVFKSLPQNSFGSLSGA
ncbi:VPA1269 family protein [Neorhizobium tomejilense]|uniref:VPA1269 family protein n=1 Tax=Neorhizobium tomejilense TaxID=2093828 RepID=UPI000CFA6BA4|nr:VPA1269 family protein [Neorhizobium tomejilense]